MPWRDGQDRVRQSAAASHGSWVIKAGRDLPQDAFTYWLDGTTPPQPGRLLSISPKRPGSAAITWPPERTGDRAGS